MGLTVSAGDPFATFITGESVGSVGQRSVLYAFGRGTGGNSSVLFMVNGDVATIAVGEPIYARGADAQTSFEVAGTRPV